MAPTSRRDDPRRVALDRKDGYARASLVQPDWESSTGWLCPGCRRNTLVFFGYGPEFKQDRYVPGTDTRLCLDCARLRNGNLP